MQTIGDRRGAAVLAFAVVLLDAGARKYGESVNRVRFGPGLPEDKSWQGWEGRGMELMLNQRETLC